MRKFCKAIACLALAAALLVSPALGAHAEEKPKFDTSSYSAVTSLPKEGTKIAVTGKVDYKTAPGVSGRVAVYLTASDSAWFVCLADEACADIQKLTAVAAQGSTITVYGTYGGLYGATDKKQGTPVINVDSGAISAGNTLYTIDNFTSQPVWIPTNGGKKYHKTATCSKMENPSHVCLEDAQRMGYSACKKCYG